MQDAALTAAHVTFRLALTCPRGSLASLLRWTSRRLVDLALACGPVDLAHRR